MSALDVLAGRGQWAVEQGDVLERLREMPDESVNCVVTSPPYWGLRDYGVAGQIGLEATPDLFVARMVEVFAEVRRVLRFDGTCWVNLGDSYAGGGNGARDPIRWPKQHRNANGFRSTHAKGGHGLKEKDLVGIPWWVAFALQADGWWLRADVIWAKKAPMPESVTDRPTRSHEHVFLFAKAARYWYDADAIREPAEAPVATEARSGMRSSDLASFGLTRGSGNPSVSHPLSKNVRDVWSLGPEPYPDAHFATFPTEIPRRCVLAGCPPGGVVLDPFCGSGTALMVALRHGRRAVGIELNPAYVEMARRRIVGDSPMFNQPTDGAAG